MQPVSGKVAGPFGAITIEGDDCDVILLNGKTPEFTVGHGDEFNHDWWWKQELGRSSRQLPAYRDEGR